MKKHISSPILLAHLNKMALFLAFLFLSALHIHHAQAQLDQTVYYIYQPLEDATDSGCEDSAVAIDGQVVDDFFSQQKVPTTSGNENATCVTQTSCLLDPSSKQCLELTDGVVDTAQISVNIQQDGTLNECSSESVVSGDQLCTLSPPRCRESFSYPSCSHTLITGQELVDNPRLLLNENPPKEVDEIVYLMYYTDESCTDFAAMEGILEGNPTTFPVVNDTIAADGEEETTISCEMSLACLMNPNGSTCSALPKSGTSTLTYENRNGDMRICKGEETGEECTQVVDSSTCQESENFPGCYTTQVPASDLFQNPAFYVTPPKPVSYPLNSTFYAIFYETEGRCSGSAIAAEGGVIGDTINLQRASNENGICAAELSCLLDPFSNECFFETKGLINTVTVSVNYTSDNSLLVCDASGVSFGRPACTVNPPLCEQSNIYPSCTDSVLTGPELVAVPNAMQNLDPPKEVGRSAYLVFYTDPICLDFAAMRGVVLDAYNYFPKVDDLFFYTCQDKMVCLLNPQGKACESLSQTETGIMAYFTMEEDEDGNQRLLTCRVDNDECVPTNDSDCVSSEFYPGCYARVVWGPDMLANPVRYIVPPTDAPTGIPSEAPSSMPSSEPTITPAPSSVAVLCSVGSMFWGVLFAIAIILC
jgi:hypothetical protein